LKESWVKKIIWLSLFAAGMMIASDDGEMMAKDALKVYRKRRNLKISPEPYGTVKKRQGKKLLFVIQKHAARALHYDVRFEIDGVLVSWAVPKGPSLNPTIKRLAVRTDDHPMEYAKFEGVIPKGAYGGGTVMVWDIGKYRNIKTDDDGELIPMHECLKKGSVEVFLEGKKLEGAYALVKTKFGGREQWLMIKMRDEYANARRNPVTTQTKSALTERTMAEIRADEVERKPRKKVPPCQH
jgi:DNA ligase D-like protein (predicted 3'-phosphoesterase)